MITKPNLTTDADLAKLNFSNGYYAQPKIDGVRGIHLYGNSSITARSLKPFGNKLIPFYFPNLNGFDGEFSYGPITSSDLCRNTTSVLNTHNDTRAANLVLNIFDYIVPETEHLHYADRYEIIRNSISNDCVKLNVVPYKLITNLQDLLDYENECLAEGYEGIILRNPKGLYKSGRSTIKENTFLRLKRFIQEDAIVVSLVEANSNQNEATTNELGQTERSTHKSNLVPKGMIGSLICKDTKTGQIITVGSGKMTHIEREYYWNNSIEIVNKTISYKSMPYGKKDLPRFPTFEYIRSEEDLINE